MALQFFILASVSNREGSPLRDDARKENEFLCCELDNLQREQKKLKQIVDQLASDYEHSKRVDPVRRYERLKAMIKRTTMHLRLKQDESVATQGSGISGLIQGCKDYSYQVENAKRREEKYLSKYGYINYQRYGPVPRDFAALFIYFCDNSV